MPHRDSEPPIDYTDMAHHNQRPDPHATADPSSPQGPFWRPEDKDRVAEQIANTPLEAPDDPHSDEPGEPVTER